MQISVEDKSQLCRDGSRYTHEYRLLMVMNAAKSIQYLCPHTSRYEISSQKPLECVIVLRSPGATTGWPKPFGKGLQGTVH